MKIEGSGTRLVGKSFGGIANRFFWKRGLRYTEWKSDNAQIVAGLEQAGWRTRGPGGAAALLGLNPTARSSGRSPHGCRGTVHDRDNIYSP